MKSIKIKEASIGQWEKLYKTAMEIKQRAPWERLWDSELFTVFLPDFDEPILVSVMGRNGECFGITVYPGYESIMGYCALAQSDDDEPFFSKMSHQNCLTCYFGDREELDAGEREIIKQLGYKFRGHNNWIYFRSMKTGYFPWSLGAEQVVFLTEALSQFLAAYDDFSSGRVKADFSKEETVMRKFDAEKGEWRSWADKLPPFLIDLPRYIIDNDILIHSIKKKAVGKKSIEFDMVFLPFPVQEKKDEVPYMPCMFMLADRENGLILDQHIVSGTEKEENIAIGMLEEYVKKHGRPSALYVRDFRFQRYLADLCQKTDIQLIEGEDMPSINEAVEQLIEHMGGR